MPKCGTGSISKRARRNLDDVDNPANTEDGTSEDVENTHTDFANVEVMCAKATKEDTK